MSNSPSVIQSIRAGLRSDMLTLRWVLLGLYLALVVGLSVPFFLDADDDASGLWLTLISVLVVGQVLFIFGAGTINLCHPIRKTRLWMPVLVASVMAAILAAGVLMALAELWLENRELVEPWNWVLWCALLGNWIFWAPLFWAYTRRKVRRDALARLATWLFVGSLVELLVCVPSHIITSRRSYCLAGMFTMLGIIAGVYVMLFTFGPALALLFLRPRYRREQLEGDAFCPACGYNLRGTLEAGRRECPECGRTTSIKNKSRSAGSI